MKAITGSSAPALPRCNHRVGPHPDDAAKDLELFQALYNNSIPSYSIEKRYLRKDGSIVWGALTVSAIRDSNDDFAYAVGMVDDITQRKRAEEALRDSEEKFRGIFNNAQVGMFRTQISDGKLLECN